VTRKALHEQLHAVKTTLARRAREEAQHRHRETQAAKRTQAERELFPREVERTLGQVHRLAHHGRAERARPAPEATPRQRLADEAQALASTLSDEFDAATLLDTDAELAFAREGIGPDVLARLRRGRWSVQRHLDLHGLTRERAREALARFLRTAARDGLRCVRIVHGKGNGSPGRTPVLKAKVRAWLMQSQAVSAFAQAPASEGGHGAVLVLLSG
jgi:DNA-nicking Smr family endonuclease